jgi:nitrate reductase gamma subunit
MRFTPVVIILVVISIVGAIAIPFGDPQFLDRAIALELLFITLAILTYKDFRKALYACIPLAVIVMVGNSLASPHVEMMTTFSKPFNAIMLIIGGYVLQAALIGTTILLLVRTRQGIVQKQKN